MTTATVNVEAHNQADSALRLLRLVSKILGPVNAEYAKALGFKGDKPGSSRNSRAAILQNDGARQVGADRRQLDETTIMSRYVKEESLFACAEDFWHVAGWAFNCSRLHMNRWQRWRLWLEWIIDALENDWRCRLRNGDISSSLIVAYMPHSSWRSRQSRRIMRAIFANGNNKAINEFGQVFRNELRKPNMGGSERVKRREVDVNVEAEVYGDYMTRDDDDDDDDDDDKEENSQGKNNGRETLEETKDGPLKPLLRGTQARNPNLRKLRSQLRVDSIQSGLGEVKHDDSDEGLSCLGGNDSLKLRMKLLQLLSELSMKLPDIFETNEELYTLFVEFIRPLPLPTFQAVVSPCIVPDVLSTDSQTTLCEFLLTRSLLEAAAPPSNEPWLRQSKMEQCYLPFAATSTKIADNAKVSLCLESLMQHLLLAGKVVLRPDLESAVDEGIRKRCSKAKDGSKKAAAAQKQEEKAWTSLRQSSERLRLMCKSISVQDHRV